MSTNPTSFRLPTALQIPTHIDHNGQKIPIPQPIRDNVRLLFNGLLDAHQAIISLNQKVGSIAPSTNVTNVTNQTIVQGGSVPGFNTSGQGYFFSAGLFLPIAAISRGIGSSWSPSANKVNVVQFTIPFGVTFQISKFSINVIAGDIGQFAAFGIYSSDGNTKLFDSGPMSLSINTVVTSSVTAASLTSGTYYWAQTGTTNTATLNTTSSLSTNDANLMNANAAAPRIAVAANVSAAGNLPATLGALTAVSPATSFDMALVMLEP